MKRGAILAILLALVAAAAGSPAQAQEAAANHAGPDPATAAWGKHFLQACWDRDLATVERFLNNGVDVNVRQRDGRTALHIAACQGDLDLADLLLARGAQVNARDDQRRTPLHEAARREGRDLARLLLEHGAEVDARDEQGQTPLLVAKPRDVDMERELLAHGADPNARAPGGGTFLHSLGISPLVMWDLLEHGADANARDDESKTPLVALAGWCSDDEDAAAEALLDHGADPNAADKEGATALFLVAKRAAGWRFWGPLQPVFPVLHFGRLTELLRKRGAEPDLVTLSLLGDASGARKLLEKVPGGLNQTGSGGSRRCTRQGWPATPKSPGC